MFYFFNEMIFYFFYIFQSKFLTYVFLNHIQSLLIKEVLAIKKHKINNSEMLLYFCSLRIFLNFFWNIFNSKAVKLSYIITINIENYLTRSYWFVLIKIYYVCPIFCFRWIISWINTIKVTFIFIILLYFKIS